MKRKTNSQNQIGYQQFEDRRMLAAIANGQEIQSIIPVGGSETFEFQVERSGPVRVAVGQDLLLGEPQLEIFDPNGLLVHSSSAAPFVGFTYAAFDATIPGQYTAVVQDVDNDSTLSFRVRVAAFANSTFIIPDALQSVDFGEQLDLDSHPLGSGPTFSIFQFDTEQETTIGILANAFRVTTNFDAETQIEVFDSNGNLVTEGTRDELNIATFTSTASETYSVLYRSTDGSSILGNARVQSFSGATELITGQDFVLENGREYLTPFGEFDSQSIVLLTLDIATSSTGVFSLSRLGTSGAAPRDVVVLSPDGEIVETTRLDTDMFGRVPLEFEAQEAGSYTIVLTIDSGASSPYRIRALSFDEEPILVEGRDSVISDSGTDFFELEEGAVGVFSIEAPTDGKLAISAGSVNFFLSADPVIAIYDQTGQRVAFNTARSQTELILDVVAGERYTAIFFEENGRILSNAFFTATFLSIDNGNLIPWSNGQETLVQLRDRNFFGLSIEAEQGVPLVISLGTPNGNEGTFIWQLFDSNGQQVSNDRLEILNRFPDGGVATVVHLLPEESEIFTLAVVSETDSDVLVRTLSLDGGSLAIDGRDGLLASPGQEVNTSLSEGESAFFQIPVEDLGLLAFHLGTSEGAVGLLDVLFFNPAGEELTPQLAGETTRLITVEELGLYTAVAFFRNEGAPVDLKTRVLSTATGSQLIQGRDFQLEDRISHDFELPSGASSLLTFDVTRPGLARLNLNIEPNSPFQFGFHILDPTGQNVGGNIRIDGPVMEEFSTGSLGTYTIVVYDRGNGLDHQVTAEIALLPGDPALTERLGNGQEIVDSIDSLGAKTVSFAVSSPGRVIGRLGISTAQNSNLQLFVLSPSFELVSRTSFSSSGDFDFEATETGDYLFLIENLSPSMDDSIRLRAVSFSSPFALLPQLDQPLRNGQEITATLPTGGLSIIPLDIDFESSGFGILQVYGASVDSVVTPRVLVYNDAGEVVQGSRPDFLGEFRRRLGLSFLQSDGPLFAVVTNSSNSEPIEFTLRAFRSDSPSTLIPGRDAVLEDGTPFISTVPDNTFAHFPIEVAAPGTFTIDVEPISLDANSPASFFSVEVIDPNGSPIFIRSSGTELNAEIVAAQSGAYQVVVSLTARSNLPFRQNLGFQIEVNGISRVEPTVTSFERDGRISGREEVLARPNIVETLTFRFNQDVVILAEDLILQNDSIGGSSVDLSGATFSYDASTLSATWDLSTLAAPLPAGFYSTSLAAGAITSQVTGDAMSEDFSGGFYVALIGDRNLDGVVDVLGDAFPTSENVGITQGALWSDGDFNGDGAVTVVGDVLALIGNLNQSVVPVTEPTVLLGDVNQDDSVDFLDISPFISVLSSNMFQAEADVNQDGVVSFLDITPFIGVLSSQRSVQLSFADLMKVSSGVSDQKNDEINVELDATSTGATLPGKDVADAQLSDSASKASLQPYTSGSQPLDGSNSLIFRNEIPVSNSNLFSVPSQSISSLGTPDLSAPTLPLSVSRVTNNNNDETLLPNETDEFNLALAGDVTVERTVDGVYDTLDAPITIDPRDSSASLDEVFAELDL